MPPDRHPAASGPGLFLLLGGVASVLLGFAVIIGWHFRWETLVQVRPEFVPTQYNAALGFLFSGAALLFLCFGRARWAAVVGAVVAGFSGLSLLQYFAGMDLGIDQVFFRSYITVETSHPGRMAPNTGVAFVLFGTAMLILGRRRRSPLWELSAGVLGLMVFILGALALYGYATGIPAAFGWGTWTRMAVLTGVGFVVLGLGLMPRLWPGEIEVGKVDTRELRRSLLAYSVGAALAIALLSAFLAVLILHSKLEEAELSRLAVLTGVKKSAIEQIVGDAGLLLEQISSRTRARQLLEDFERGLVSRGELEAETQKILDDALRASPAIWGIARLDGRGEVVAQVGDSRVLTLWPGGEGGGAPPEVMGPFFLDGDVVVLACRQIRGSGLSPLAIDLVLARLQGLEAVIIPPVSVEGDFTTYLGVRQDVGIGIYGRVGPGGGLDSVEAPPEVREAMAMALLEGEGTILPRVGPEAGGMAVGYAGTGTIGIVVAVPVADLLTGLPGQLALIVVNILALVLLGGVGTYLLLRPLATGMVYQADALRREVEKKTAAIQQELAIRQRVEEEVRNKGRDLQTLLYVISHDLREPLRAIDSFSRMVRDRYEGEIDAKGRDFLARIVRAAGRMDELLEDILKISRIQQIHPPADLVDAREVVDAALERLEENIRSRGAKVTVGGNLPRLRTDKTWAGEAVYNLLDNAIKFTPAGEVPEVEVDGLVLNGGERGVVVRDRGAGVPDGQEERIFELFQRGVDPEVPGTGAGLAVARQIAERHGGRVWMRPREGGGTEFFITFNAAQEEEANQP